MAEQTEYRQKPSYESFHVTARSFSEILESCQLTTGGILALPQGARIVEVGSGINQEFARGVKGLRNDLTVISIDPSLKFSPNRKDVLTSKSDSGKAVTYSVNPLNKITKKDNKRHQAIQLERIKNARLTGKVTLAKAPELPFSPNSIDLVVDSAGAALYLDREEFKKYFQSLATILSINGEAYVYPISGNLFRRSPAEKVQAEAEMKELFDLHPELEGECYFIRDSLGFTIKKKSIPDSREASLL